MRLPDSTVLAALVCRITETMFGLSFTLDDDAGQRVPPLTPQRPWRYAELPIEGAHRLLVAIASDEPGCRALGGALFACADAALDSSMVDDSMRELANVVAGQVKMAMGLDQHLGLPSIGHGDWIPPDQNWRGALLRNSTTEIKVWVAVAERPAPAV